MKKLIILLCLSACASTTLRAQEVTEDDTRWQQIITTKVPATARMSAQLYQLAVLAREDNAEAMQRLRRSELRHDAATGRVNIEVVLRPDQNTESITDRIDGAYLRGLGFDVEQTWKNRASIWMPLEDLLEKTNLLPTDYFTFLVTIPRHDDEGPGVMNSNTYTGGFAPGGAGKRIAIFDGGFLDLQGAINAGKAKVPAYVGIGGIPSTVAGVNYAKAQHGTACVETVYDHVPNAVFEIYANGNTTQKGAAVDSCIAHGVNIISMSQSEYNEGWSDNSGAACAYAQDAAAAGLLFFTSCGNRAESHYEAFFSDANSNQFHEFAPGDDGNSITTPVADSESTHAYLSWVPTTGTDFDIFIVRSSDNFILASATAGGTGVSGYETVSWTNNLGLPVSVYFMVKRYNGPATTFEMFTHNAGNYQYATAAGSNTSPSNSTNPNVISVGAVSYPAYGSASGTANILESYSSRGPTNDNNLAPKISGPTNTTTRAYSGAFSGTSCATPNVAGAACAFWSANPNLDANGVRQIIIAKARGYKDWGTAGADNLYGSGALFLYPWASTVRYMLRTPENTGVTNATRPFQTLLIAEQQTPANGTVVILSNGNYPETGLYGTIFAGSGKSVLYRSPFPSVTANFGF